MRAPVFLLVLLALAGAARAETAPIGSSIVPADSWAVVESRSITKSEVQRLSRLYGRPEGEVLERLVTQEILAARLDRDGVGPGSVPASELDAARRDMRELLKRAGKDLEQEMKSAGISAEELDASLRIACAFRRRIERDATDAALGEAFEKRYKLDLAGEVRARHVFVRVRANEAAALQTAMLVLGAVKADGSNVADLARSHSDDPNAAFTGGDLDWFSRRSRLPGQRPSPYVPEAVARAAFDHGRTGLIPQPVRGRDGYHVIWVTGIRYLAEPSFAEHREVVKNRFLRDRSNDLLETWRREARVERAADAPKVPEGFPIMPGGR